jgi:hypothetical protein
MFWFSLQAVFETFIIIKMDLREVAWGGMDWINLAQG